MTMSDCIHLRDLFGDTYRITWNHAREGREESPWLMQIPCALGTIYPHGADRLAVEIDYHPKAARAIAALPGVKLHQDGDQEKTFLFPVAMFDQVAAVVQPRRRRRLDPDIARRIGAASQFQTAHSRVPGPLEQG